MKQYIVTSIIIILMGLYPAVSAQAQESTTKGEKQVALIMHDRPKLAVILKTHPGLCDWLVKEFNTKRGGFKPLWDPREPVSGRPAEHEYPSTNLRAGIVAKGTVVFRVDAGRSGWDQLAGLIFELHNFRGAARFEEIYLAAVSGKIDKKAFVRQNLQQEFVALKAAKDFLIKNVVHLPGAQESENTLLWGLVHSADTLKELLGEHKQRGYDLRTHYEKLYETEVVPKMK